MPELPDLQVISKNLSKRLAGKTVKNIIVHVDKKLNTTKAKLKKALVGKILVKVIRVGKELHFIFSGEIVLGIHLMLHGKCFLFAGKNTEKHSILEVHFTDGTELVVIDFQKQATPKLNPENKDIPDALSKELTPTYLQKITSNTSKYIKVLSMDQSKIRGIGNAYADEILAVAAIHPESNASKIPMESVKKLPAIIKKVLKNAEKEIIKEAPDLINGELRSFLKVHNPNIEKTSVGEKILKKSLNGRPTYFTTKQILYK